MGARRRIGRAVLFEAPFSRSTESAVGFDNFQPHFDRVLAGLGFRVSSSTRASETSITSTCFDFSFRFTFEAVVEGAVDVEVDVMNDDEPIVRR